MWRAAAVLAATGTFAAAAFAGSGAVTRASGLHGTVTLVRAICAPGIACDSPVAGVTIVFTRSGQAVRRHTKTSGAGGYRIVLAPGVYTVSSPEAPAPRGRVTPTKVRVYAGRLRRVNFVLSPAVKPQ